MPRERYTDYQRMASQIAEKCADGKCKLYLIVAEGAETEPKYFLKFKKIYGRQLGKSNLHIEFIDRTDPTKSYLTHVLETLDNFCLELSSEYDLKAYDELWIVIDTDDHEKTKDEIVRLQDKCDSEQGYKLGLSNPCFELWMILHFADYTDIVYEKTDGRLNANTTIKEHIEAFPKKIRPGECKELFKHIHTVNNYSSQLYDKLTEPVHVHNAIKRARRLGGCSPKDSRYPDEIGTELYKLMSKLLPL